MLGLGRDASYAAAERGEIPCIQMGRRRVVSTYRLLELAGWPEHLIARALGLPAESEDPDDRAALPPLPGQDPLG